MRVRESDRGALAFGLFKFPACVLIILLSISASSSQSREQHSLYPEGARLPRGKGKKRMKFRLSKPLIIHPNRLQSTARKPRTWKQTCQLICAKSYERTLRLEKRIGGTILQSRNVRNFTQTKIWGRFCLKRFKARRLPKRKIQEIRQFGFNKIHRQLFGAEQQATCSKCLTCSVFSKLKIGLILKTIK